MNLTKIILIAILFCSLSVYGQFFPSSYDDTELVVIYDRTDSLQSVPDRKQIQDYFNLKQDKWKGAHFSCLPVTNIRWNKEIRIDLEARSQWFSNELERNNEVKQFYAGIDAALTQIENIPIGTFQSSIYTPLARKLNSLVDAEVGVIEVYVFSDLMEHGTSISFYDPRTLALMQESPDQVIDQLQKLCPLKSLDNITIHLYFLPKNTVEDEQFEIVSTFYKTMLEGKGATVVTN